MGAVTQLTAARVRVKGDEQVQWVYVSFELGERTCELAYRVVYRIDQPLPYYRARGFDSELTIVRIEREIDRKLVPAQLDAAQRELITEYVEQTEALEGGGHVTRGQPADGGKLITAEQRQRCDALVLTNLDRFCQCKPHQRALAEVFRQNALLLQEIADMGSHRSHAPLFLDERTQTLSLPAMTDLREPGKRGPEARTRPTPVHRWWRRIFGIGESRPNVPPQDAQ